MKDYIIFIKRYKILIPLITVLVFESAKSSILQLTSKAFELSLNAIGTCEIKRNVLLLIITQVSVLIFTKLKWVVSSKLREGLAERYRNDIFEKVTNLNISDLQTFSLPTLTVAIQSAYEVAEVAILIPLSIVRALSIFVSSAVIMISTDMNLTLIILASSSVIIVLFNKLQINLKKYTNIRKETATKLNKCIGRLEGYLTIKSFSNEKLEVKNYKNISKQYKEAALKKKFATQNASFSINILSSFIEIMIIFYIMKSYDGNIVGSISKGLLFYTLNMSLIDPFLDIPEIVDMITTLKVHLSSNEKILSKNNEYDGKINLSSFNDSIEFKNVSFSYDDTKTTLKNINIKIPKGVKVGIYGPSGSGKSTFINLLNRFYQIESGEILIDGININEFTNNSLRRIIGNVNQEIFLFSDMSIKDNIKYGLECSDEKVKQAAKLANADTFICQLKDGYDSMIGNNGVLLSGGERQRIALARLFLLDPPIIILDEATSKLDNDSEDAIKESIENLSKNKTVISIAHRFTTIENSDILIGIKDHTIYEYGSNDHIHKHGKLFNSLHR